MELRPLKDLSRYLQSLVEGRLWLKVLIGLGLGIVFGGLLGPTAGLVPAERALLVTSWVALPGNLFIRLVQMIMVPLILSSIVQGIAGGESKDQLRAMGTRVAVYFVLTVTLSVLVGVGLALWIEPGALIDAARLGVEPAPALASATERTATSPWLEAPGAISRLLPTNPLAAMVSGEMLNIVIFAVIAGVALAALDDDKAAPVLHLLSSVQEICMTITRWAMRLAPVAVFGLISQVVARVGLEAITGLAMYMTTVLLALLVLVLLNALAVHFVARFSLRTFFRETREVLLLAFSVASSAAVMPLSLKTVEERLHVSPGVARFIVPVGATINMNGTAAYQAVATLFLAQVYGLDLGLMGLMLLVVTTVAASIGTPSSPGAGVIILATVLISVGIPASGVALIIGVDNLLGMCRTSVNVLGDLTASLIFDRFERRRRGLEDASRAGAELEPAREAS